MTTPTFAAAVAAALTVMIGAPLQAQAPEQTPAQRTSQTPSAQPPAETDAQRQAREAVQRASAAAQRPISSDVCTDAPPEFLDIDLDGYGNLLGSAGTAETPAYLYMPKLRITLTGPAASTLTARPTVPDEAEPGPRTLFAGGRVEFEREMLLTSFEHGGFVRVVIEARVMVPAPSPTGESQQAEKYIPITTLWIIPQKPWMVVLNEKGPIDPRFKSTGAATFLPCRPLFRYDPSEPAARAWMPLVIGPPDAFPTPESPSPRRQPLVIQPRSEGDLAWTELETDAEERRADLAIVLNGAPIGALSLTLKRSETFPPARPRNEGGQLLIPIVLDRTGVASWQYLNRRRPPFIDETTATAANAFLRFRNTLPDRQFIVTISGIAETERPALMRAGVSVTGCGGGTCSAAVRVAANGGVALVPLRPLRNSFAKGGTGGLMTFQVTFYDDDATPTNRSGYVTFVDEQHFVEPGSTTTWTAGVSATLQSDPDLSPLVPAKQKLPVITFARPWGSDGDENREHVGGSASLNVKQTLGTRADAELELTAKRGDFGQDSASVQAGKYFANVYAAYDLTLTGGRFDLIVPTSGISLAESGEAVQGALRIPKWNSRIGLAKIFRKQIPQGSFTVEEEQKALEGGASVFERRHSGWVAQLRDVVPADRGLDWLRLSFYGVHGRADRGQSVEKPNAETDPPDKPKTRELIPYTTRYETFGADASFTAGQFFLSAGLYHNRRNSTAPETLMRMDNAEGMVGLATFSYTNPDRDDTALPVKQNVDLVASVSYGMGGAYVGETQNFTPDVLMLGTFASPLKEPSLIIGSGLTNKHYLSAVITTPKLDYLKAVAKKLKLPAGEINSSSATLKVHQYWLRDTLERNPSFAAETFRSGALGTEIDFEFMLESPKGVRYQLTLAGLWPGKALEGYDSHPPLVTGFQGLAKLAVTVRFD